LLALGLYSGEQYFHIMPSGLELTKCFSVGFSVTATTNDFSPEARAKHDLGIVAHGFPI